MNPRFWLAVYDSDAQKIAEPDTPVEVLRFIAQTPDTQPYNYYSFAAQNPAAPPDVLEGFFARFGLRTPTKQSLYILEHLAKNNATSSDLLSRLYDHLEEVGDAEYETRLETKRTHWQKALEAQYAAVANPNFPVDRLREIGQRRGSTSELEAVAGNPNAPADVVAVLAESGFDKVWEAAYKNPNLPLEVLKRHSGSAHTPTQRQAASLALVMRQQKDRKSSSKKKSL